MSDDDYTFEKEDSRSASIEMKKLGHKWKFSLPNCFGKK